MAGGPGMLWGALLACAVVIAGAGAVLCREAEVIARRTGLGATWTGMVMLGTVTSLPELVTGLSAVVLADAPDIAVGDALGSCLFNLALLGALWAWAGDAARAAAARHRPAALLGAGLLAVASLGFAFPAWSLGSVGAATPGLLAGYALALRALFRRMPHDGPSAPRGDDGGLQGAVTRYAMAAAVVSIAGSALPFVAVGLASAMGWTQSLVGTLLVAVATSLPELAVTLAAARMGAFEMAAGNLLGSNLFDMAILGIDDAAFTSGPLFASVSTAYVGTSLVAVAMSIAAALPARRATGLLLLALYGLAVASATG